MSAPKRIQLSRAKGWRKPEGAIVVARPSEWGNPFKVGDVMTPDALGWPIVAPEFAPWRAELGGGHGWQDFTITDVEQAVAMYRVWAERVVVGGYTKARRAAAYLRGHDLACWCPLDQPCHADVLLELANR